MTRNKNERKKTEIFRRAFWRDAWIHWCSSHYSLFTLYNWRLRVYNFLANAICIHSVAIIWPYNCVLCILCCGDDSFVWWFRLFIYSFHLFRTANIFHRVWHWLVVRAYDCFFITFVIFFYSLAPSSFTLLVLDVN